MCAAVDSEMNNKKVKQKFMLWGYCNDILNRIASPSSKSMMNKSLKTDAVPTNSGAIQVASKDNESNNENTAQHLNVAPRSDPIQHAHSMQMIQNNLNQASQNLTVIESQQNLHFNNIHGLQIGNTFHVSGTSSRKNIYNGSYEDKGNGKKTRSLIELMNCGDPIEMPTMRIAARYIGENWRMVFRDLDIPDSEIAQIKEQYFHISVEEVIYQLLLRWQRSCDDPSLGKLTTTLWANKNHDCVAELKKYFKKLKKSQQAEANEQNINRNSACDRESD